MLLVSHKDRVILKRLSFIVLVATAFAGLKLIFLNKLFTPIAPNDELLIKEFSALTLANSRFLDLLLYGNPVLPFIGTGLLKLNKYNFSLIWSYGTTFFYSFLPLMVFTKNVQKKLSIDDHYSWIIYLVIIFSPYNLFTHLFMVEILIWFMALLILFYCEPPKTIRSKFIWTIILLFLVSTKALGYSFLLSFFAVYIALPAIKALSIRRTNIVHALMVFLVITAFLVLKNYLLGIYGSKDQIFGAPLYRPIFKKMLDPNLYLKEIGFVSKYFFGHAAYIFWLYGGLIWITWDNFKTKSLEENHTSLFFFLNTLILLGFTILFSTTISVMFGEGESNRIHSRYYFFSLVPFLLTGINRKPASEIYNKTQLMFVSLIVASSTFYCGFFLKVDFKALSLIDNHDLLWFMNPQWYLNDFNKEIFKDYNPFFTALVLLWGGVQLLLLWKLDKSKSKTTLGWSIVIFFLLINAINYKIYRNNSKGLNKQFSACIKKASARLEEKDLSAINIVTNDWNDFLRIKYALISGSHPSITHTKDYVRTKKTLNVIFQRPKYCEILSF